MWTNNRDFMEGASKAINRKISDLEQRYGFSVPNYGTPNQRWEITLEMLDELIYR